MAVTLKGQSAIYEGTSADMKPSDADKNAIFQELDTGIDYYYDGTNWNEIPSSGGGGGGTGTDNYNDLNNKPSINGTTLSGNKSLNNLGIQAKLTFDSAPTEDSENPVTSGGVYTALATNIQGIKVNGSTVNPDSNKVVNITVPTSAADVSALPDTTKYAAALKLTINSSTFVMTGQLKDQDGNNLGTAQTIDLPLESVVVGGSYNSQTKKVVLTLQNGNTIEFSVADLVSGLQTELSASNKLNPAYIDYDSTHAAVTEAQRDQIETNKNNISWNANNGVKNVLDFQTWIANCSVVNATKTVGANTINIAAGSSNSYTEYLANYPTNTDINVNEGDIYQLSWTYSRTGGSGRGIIYAYAMDNSNTVITSANAQGTTGKLSITVPTGATKLRLSIAVPTNTGESYSRMMICLKSLYDAEPSYQPYALSNAELTAAIKALQAQLANQ